MNLLNDSDWLVHSKDETDDEITVSATYQPAPPACLHCGVVGKPFKHGVQEQLYRDAPAFGKRITILAFRQRYRCRDCKRTFLQPLPVDENRKMTRRCIEYIEKRFTAELFTHIASEVGVTEGTVRNIFADWSERMKQAFAPKVPRWLGIDELWLLKKPRLILTNVLRRRLVDMLADREKSTMMRYLSLHPERDEVVVVAMDMWTHYRDAVRVMMPQAVIVVDKFHVIAKANFCLDKVRKDLRDSLTAAERKRLMRDRRLLLQRKKSLTPMRQLTLDTWLDNFPTLRAAYDAKEAFYEVYDAPDKADAEIRYNKWLASLTEETRIAFFLVIREMTNWRIEIFAYWDHKYTNAYTESANGLIKIANRLGRGYSFEVIRAKMLYNPRFKDIPGDEGTSYAAPKVDEAIARYIAEHGVDIDALRTYLIQSNSTSNGQSEPPAEQRDSTDFYE